MAHSETREHHREAERMFRGLRLTDMHSVTHGNCDGLHKSAHGYANTPS